MKIFLSLFVYLEIHFRLCTSRDQLFNIVIAAALHAEYCMWDSSRASECLRWFCASYKSPKVTIENVFSQSLWLVHLKVNLCIYFLFMWLCVKSHTKISEIKLGLLSILPWFKTQISLLNNSLHFLIPI